jgi:hypothetical protein
MLRIRASKLVSLTTCLALAAPGCELDEYLAGLDSDAGYADDAGPSTPDLPNKPDKPDTAGKPGRPPKPVAGRPAPIVQDAGAEPHEQDAGAADGGAAIVPDTFGLTSRGRLISFERASGKLAAAYEVTGLEDDEWIVGADIRPSNGMLYALTDRARLYTVDLTTGAAALDSKLSADPADASEPFSALRGTKFGVDWNPVPDRLRVVSDQGQNLRIQPATGLTTTDGAINPSATLAAAAYTNSFAAACRTRLFVIDAEAHTLFLQDPPNDGRLVPVGALKGLADVAVSSFEIQTSSDGVDSALIAAVDGYRTQLFDLNLTSGAATHPRELHLDDNEALVALSALPPSAAPVQAPGELLGLSESGRLISFNRAAPGKLCTSSAIAGLAEHEHVLGIDVRPADGKLYALGSSAKLYTLDASSGEASFVAALAADPLDTTDPYQALYGSEFALAFNPVPDRLRVTSDLGQNLRIQVTSGNTITDAALSGAAHGVTAAAYTNAFAGAKSTTLFAIDSYADALVRIGGDPATGGACAPDVDANNPNCGVVSAIGALGLGDTIDLNGFDIDSRNGNAFAALSLTGASTSVLYSINLQTGAAALPPGVANGTIGGGERVRGLTLAANPVVTATALTSDGQLLGFAPSAPGDLQVQVWISGLVAGESLLGIDVRAADGKLYGLGSANNLYTLDRTSGTATLVTPLAAASGDDLPFAMLAPNDYGVDFNPAADLLRVVDSYGGNLRVAPSARAMLRLGDVVTDAQLNPGEPNAVAAGYTNNFAGTTQTTLYLLDLSSDTLQLQGGVNGTPSPNIGTLTTVGHLGFDAAGDAGFDIVGGHNGLALAALQVGDTRTALYSIQLATGAATPFDMTDNFVGVDGTQPVLGLALDLK